MVADTSLDYLHGSGAQLVEAAGSSKPQIHKGSSARESAFVSDENYGECVVAIHVPPIKGTAQVNFKVVDGTEPTLSMTMLVANGNKLVLGGENARLITAKGETAPLTSIENDRYLKVLINDSNEFIRIDLWTPCHVCPPSWVRSLSPEMKQREQYVVRETTTTGMWDYETVTKPTDNSSPEQTGAAGKIRNTQMLEDVEEPKPTERYHTNAESAISPLEETDILSLSRDEEMEVLRSLSSWNDYVMDDAELLKDLRGLGKPQLFDDNHTDASFLLVFEHDSILPRHMDDVVNTSPDKCHRHRAIGEMANPRNQHIEIPQIQHTDKDADDSIVIRRQISPRTTETKADEHQQDDRSGGDANKDIQGESFTKHCWSGGKKVISICKQRFFTLTITVCTLHFLKIIDLAHEIPGVNVAQKTWHKLLDDASTKEAVADDAANSNSLTHSPSQSWSKETKSSGFAESVGNSTNDQDSAKMPEMWITTVNFGRRSTVMELASETTVATSSLNTMGTKSNNAGKGKDNHVEVVERNEPSETAPTMSAIESDDADESMNMVKPGTEAWRLIHSRYAQNTTEMISGSLLHDHADKYNQLPDELKEQTHTGNQRHELQPVDIRSLDEYRTKFRDEHNEITKTMKDLSIIQHQTELEEKAGNYGKGCRW